MKGSPSVVASQSHQTRTSPAELEDSFPTVIVSLLMSSAVQAPVAQSFVKLHEDPSEEVPELHFYWTTHSSDWKQSVMLSGIQFVVLSVKSFEL